MESHEARNAAMRWYSANTVPFPLSERGETAAARTMVRFRHTFRKYSQKRDEAKICVGSLERIQCALPSYVVWGGFN